MCVCMRYDGQCIPSILLFSHMITHPLSLSLSHTHIIIIIIIIIIIVNAIYL